MVDHLVLFHAAFLPSFFSQRKMRMQAMFMEDDVVETSDVDDVRYNMRRALRANQVRIAAPFTVSIAISTVRKIKRKSPIHSSPSLCPTPLSKLPCTRHT